MRGIGDIGITQNSCQPSQQAPLHAALDGLDHNVKGIASACSELIARLNPIMRPDPPSEQANEKDPAPDLSTGSVTSRVRSAAKSLMHLRMIIEEKTKLLDL